MSQQMVTLNIEEAVVQIPQATVMRNFLNSLDPSEKSAHSIPKIGKFWHGQGGINAGLMRGSGDNPDYWIIVPTDKAASFESTQWGSEGKEEPDACCEYDGLANTTVLAESQYSHPAAEKIAELKIGLHSDFYLPARRELSLLYANVPELFEKAWHWSSTQYSVDSAWSQLFISGYQGHDDKEYKARARAVRRLTI